MACVISNAPTFARVAGTVPLPVEAVTALASVVPSRYQALVVLAAGTGRRKVKRSGSLWIG